MGSSIDFNAGHRTSGTGPGSRPTMRSQRAFVTWPAGPRDAIEGLGGVADQRSIHSPGSIALGALEIIPGARTVRVNSSNVDLGSRAFDLLMVLVNAHGDVVSKEAIIAEVWPTTTVVESNLKVQLSILRRALGAERWRIKTVSGRGYMLTLDAAPRESLTLPKAIEATAAGKPLVIVIDADPTTQAQMMRAISHAAKGIEGITRLNMIAGDQRNQ